MNLSLRYKKSLLAISLVALPWLVDVAPSQAQELGSKQLIVTPSKDRKTEADRLAVKGKQLFYASKYQESLQAYEQGLQIYREIKERSGEAKSLLGLGASYLNIGENQKAIENYQQSLAIKKEIGERYGEVQSLIGIGRAYGSLRQYQKEIEYYQQSLAIAKQIGDRYGEGDSLNNLGAVYNDLRQHQKAIEYYEQSLAIKKELNDRKGEGNSLNNVGLTYKSLGQYQKAIEYYEQSLAIKKELSDRNGEAVLLNNVGIAYNSLKKYQKAIEYYEQSLAIKKELSDRNGEGTLLNNLGLAYNSLKKYQMAIEYYEQSLAIKKELIDRKGEGNSLNNLGLAYESLKQYQRAIEYYEQSLAIYKEVGDRNSEVILLDNLAKGYKSLGQLQKTVEYYHRLLVISKQIGNRDAEATLIGTIGEIYLFNTKNFENANLKAINCFQIALAIFKQIGKRESEAAMLGQLGKAYYNLDQYQKAIDYTEQSLPIYRKLGIQFGEVTVLDYVASTYYYLGNHKKSLDYFQQALRVSKQIKNRNKEQSALVGIGASYIFLKQYEKAIDTYQQSLALSKRIGKNGKIELRGLGYAYYSLQQYDKALEYHQQDGSNYFLGLDYYALGNYAKALEYFQKELEDNASSASNKRSAEAEALKGIGDTLAKMNQPELAILYYKKSVNITESIRKDIRKLDKEDQQIYLDKVADAYRALADLLLKQDRILEAQQVLDLLKVQELSDYLRTVRGNTQTEIGLSFLRPEQNFIALGLELADLLKRDPRTPEQEQRLADLTFQERDQNKRFSAFLQIPEVKKLIEELTRQEDRENIKVAEYNSLRKKLAQVKNAALFYPLILDDRLELILITTTSPPIRKTINLKRTDLNKDILDFRKSLSDPTSTTVQADAQKFYNYLIKPFESELKQAKIETIIYAPDGQLRYIPLAALHDGKQWLIENYRVNNITASSLTNFAPRPYNVPKVFAAAATQSQTINLDEQPNRSISFNPLPATKIEVEAIKTLIPKTEIFIDQKFDEKSTLEMQKYSIVHLATHGYFAVGQAEKSFLLYGDGKTASMTDIQGWSLTNVDLVILSACETAIGGKVGSGIEILGLGYQIQTAGAGAAIASLWKVDDVGTQTLMQKLYESLKQKDTSSSEALRQAQIGMIRSDQTVSSSDRAAGIKIVGTVPKFPDGKLSHPYYWSAFILIGNGL